MNERGIPAMPVLTVPELFRDEHLRATGTFEDALLAAQFTPATAFGQPTSGRISVSFRTSIIDVRG